LEDLINRCWDVDPLKRPSAVKLSKILHYWNNDAQFTHQLQVAKEHNQTLPTEIKSPQYEIHQGAVYHSKAINTKQITKLLERYHATGDLDLDINNFNLDELNIADDQEAQIEIPPKTNTNKKE
jgi:hypothetical protein